MKSASLLSVLLSFVLHASGQSIAAGGNHSTIICSSGAISTGSNSQGQLGSGSLLPNSIGLFETVSDLSGIADISAADEHTLFRMTDGTVYACGKNDDGRLGIGNNSDSGVPVQVSGLTDVIKISAGRFHSLFLKSDGTVWTCGDNYYGTLGDGTNNNSNVPVQVSGLANVVDIAGGSNFSLFLRFNGEVWSCGYNGEGQLGTTNYTNTNIPVLSTTSGMGIAAGYGHSLILKTNGTVYACGYNGSGQLGLGGTGGGTNTLLQLGLTNIVDIAGGKDHSLFLKDDGTVWAVGDDYYGQLGVQSVNGYETFPQQLTDLSDVTEISAGDNHSMFKTSDGTILACGSNEPGQLGIGTYGGGSHSDVPVEMNVNCTVTAIDNSALNEPFSITTFPNPLDGPVTIKASSESNYCIEILDAVGKLIYTSRMKQQMTIDQNNLSNGINLVRVMDERSGETTVLRVVNP